MLALLLFTATPCVAKSLVVVLLPGTSLTDWRKADAPHLHQLLAAGAVAVMNTRTARLPNDRVRETPESAALTLGAGSRAAGGAEAIGFQTAGGVAGALYARRMGTHPPPGSFVNVQWPRVLRENTGRGYDIRPGNLADALHRTGVSVQALGGPLASAVAADGDGVINPSGSAKNACLICDAGGDVRGADALLGAVMAGLADGRLIVLSPDAGDAAYKRGDRLCPVAVWGPGVARGLIYSPSTRRAGLVTNTDFAPTVAAYFGATLPAPAFGRAWESRDASDAVGLAAAMEVGAVRQGRGLRALPFLAVLLGVWMLGVSVLAVSRPPPAWMFLVPAGIVLALIVSVSPWTLALWLGLVGLCLWGTMRRPALLFALPAMIAALLVGDMLLGDPLMRLGLLGYSAIEGARFYGMGNEAMGALVGSCLVVADRLWQRLPRQRYLVWAGLALVTALLGSPLAGAKAGGLVVALTAFGSYAYLRSGRRGSWRAAGAAAVGVAAMLLGVAALDARLGVGQASHFGLAVNRLTAGGAGEWEDIALRKLATEGRLLTHSTWAVALWGGLVGLWLLSRRARKGPLLAAGLVAVASSVAVNDAGAVAASLCLAVLWSTEGTPQTAESPGQAKATGASA